MTTHVQEVVGSNPSAVYWMDIFTLICCKNCIVCFKTPKINKKRPGLAHIFKDVKFVNGNNAKVIQIVHLDK